MISLRRLEIPIVITKSTLSGSELEATASNIRHLRQLELYLDWSRDSRVPVFKGYYDFGPVWKLLWSNKDTIEYFGISMRSKNEGRRRSLYENLEVTTLEDWTESYARSLRHAFGPRPYTPYNKALDKKMLAVHGSAYKLTTLKHLQFEYVGDQAWDLYRSIEWFNIEILETLSLSDSMEKDRALLNLAPRMKKLRALQYTRTRALPGGVWPLASSLPALEVLFIAAWPTLSQTPYHRLLVGGLPSRLRILWLEVDTSSRYGSTRDYHQFDFTSFESLEELAIFRDLNTFVSNPIPERDILPSRVADYTTYVHVHASI